MGYPVLAVIAIAASFVIKMFFLDAVFIPSLSMENTLLEGDYVLVNKFIYGSSPARLSAAFQVSPFHEVERGEVVVFKFPLMDPRAESDRARLFVKRCVAKGGDDIIFSRGDFSVIKNAHTEEPALLEEASPRENHRFTVPRKGDVVTLIEKDIEGWKPFIEREGHTVTIADDRVLLDNSPAQRYTVEKNYLFVLGDNREHSFDSRSWGFLPEENVEGKAVIVYWSVDRLLRIRWGRIGTVIR